MSTTTPLADSINALTAYANETTGASDTDLSSAVATLVAGYGSGGSVSLDDIASGAYPAGAIDISDITTFVDNAFAFRPSITSVTGTRSSIGATYIFQGCTGITTCNVAFTSSGSMTNIFANCTGLTTAVFSMVGENNTFGAFNGCTGLVTADLTVNRVRGNTFYNNNSLTTIILRNSSVTTLENYGALHVTAAFKSGGSGGTIYVPSDLISSYQADSNWSVIDGYGTITWKAIEGSTYETQYADGTAIS